MRRTMNQAPLSGHPNNLGWVHGQRRWGIGVGDLSPRRIIPKFDVEPTGVQADRRQPPPVPVV